MNSASNGDSDSSSKPRRAISIALPIFLLLFPCSLSAKESRKREEGRLLHGGFYLAAGVNHVSVGGDFDGENFLVGGGSLEIIPDVSAAEGWSAAFGWRRVNPQAGSFGEIEFDYERSNHDGRWAGFDLSGNLEFEAVDFDFRFGRGGRRLLGFGLLGLGGVSLRVPEGSTDGSTFRDATFNGASGRVGAGALVPLHKRVDLAMQAVYRFDRYNRVKGLVSGDLTDKLKGNGLTFSAALRLLAGKPR